MSSLEILAPDFPATFKCKEPVLLLLGQILKRHHFNRIRCFLERGIKWNPDANVTLFANKTMNDRKHPILLAFESNKIRTLCILGGRTMSNVKRMGHG